MNRIPAQIALLSALAAVTLAGCAATGSGISTKGTPVPAASLYEAVWQAWDGDLPDEQWIDTAALLTCKQIIGGYEPRPVADHPANNEVMVSAAEQYLCEIDR